MAEVKEKELEKELQENLKIWGLDKQDATQFIKLIDKVLLACDDKEIKKMQQAIKTLESLGLTDQAKAVQEKLKEAQKESAPNGWIIPSLKRFKKLLSEKFNIQ